MMQPTLRALARHVASYELGPILERMDVRTLTYIPGVMKWNAPNYRQMCYSYARRYERQRIWKTHMRPEGFYIERWK